MRGTQWLVAFAVWTGVASAVVGENWLAGTALPSLRAWAVLECAWLWALMTPSIFSFSHHYPVTGRPRALHLLQHAGFFLGCHVVHVFVDHGFCWIIGLRGPPSLGQRFIHATVLDVVGYTVVAAVAHAQVYYRMYDQRRTREAQLAAQLAGSRLEALARQLRPHFLFNALHTVSGLIHTRDHQGAVRALAELGDLLRAVLRQETGFEAPVRRELELAERYLELERLRFGERLESRVSVQPEALDALVPTLILQPLVENAIRHGVEATVGVVRVDIHVTVEEGMVWLRIYDTGPGLRAPSGRGCAGVGLENTRARMTALYGARHVLELVRAEEGGTLVMAAVPHHLRPWEIDGELSRG
jgi:hypothetical protein